MRHSNHKTREWGRKLKKAESRTLRARDKRAAIAESIEMFKTAPNWTKENNDD